MWVQLARSPLSRRERCDAGQLLFVVGRLVSVVGRRVCPKSFTGDLRLEFSPRPRPDVLWSVCPGPLAWPARLGFQSPAIDFLRQWRDQVCWILGIRCSLQLWFGSKFLPARELQPWEFIGQLLDNSAMVALVSNNLLPE